MLQRLRRLAHEAVKFGVVGAIGFVVDVGLFNLLRYAGQPGPLEDKPLTAKVISVTVSTIVTYAGNRHWTWPERQQARVHRQFLLFFMFNGIGMLISLVCLAVSHYVLGLHSPLADNVSANLVGLVFGMVFRFWSYRTFVFKHSPGQTAPPGHSPDASNRA
ncbi:MAG: GtrA family protein [Nocardioidaceae bacterium]